MSDDNNRASPPPHPNGPFDESVDAYRNDLRRGFQGMHERFDRLDALTAEIKATLQRIEARQK